MSGGTNTEASGLGARNMSVIVCCELHGVCERHVLTTGYHLGIIGERLTTERIRRTQIMI